MSLADFAPPSYQFAHLSKSYVLEKGWEAWLRNQHLFPSDHFILKRETHKELKTVHFYLINRTNCLKEIQEHLDDFRRDLGSDDSPEQILEKICEGSLHNLSQFAIGVLLGYGEKNAYNFERERQICRHISGKITPPFLMEKEFQTLRPLGKDLSKRCPAEKSFFPPNKKEFSVAEFNDLYDQRTSFELTDGDPRLDSFCDPRFICWENGSDIQKLKETYAKTKERIREAYKKGSFLEVTLQQWIAPQ